MAKKNKDKGGSPSKGLIPKRIAGVKVPKALREGLNASLLDNPRSRQMLADVIMAVAGAAAAALVQNRPTGKQVANAGGAVMDAGQGAATATRDAAQSTASGVSEAVAEVARHILPSSMTETRDDEREDKGEGYGHLADDDRKGKKDKQRIKASKH